MDLKKIYSGNVEFINKKSPIQMSDNNIKIDCFHDWLFYYHDSGRIKLKPEQFSAIIKAHKNFKN